VAHGNIKVNWLFPAFAEERRMSTVWFGMKLALGLMLGYAIVTWIRRELRELFSSLRFTRTGCNYVGGNNRNTPSGYMTRDVRNDDWILWEVNNKVTLRISDSDPPDATWRVSDETLDQFLELARRYQDLLKIGPAK
jgi:hypothetical protein